MRQAGRYLPEYRELRKEYSVLEIAKTPEICEQVTLMPVRKLGVDAAIIFSDIMLPLEGAGVNFKIEETLGPVVSNPIQKLEDVLVLRKFDVKDHTPFVLEAIRRTKLKLRDTSSALIGFSGGPFTIAS